MSDLKMKVPGIEVKVSGIKKLLDYTASGVGAVAGSMLANWRASKEGTARLTSARFDADVRRIEAESRAQSLVIISEAQAKARQSIDTTIESGRGMVEITPEDITQSIEFQGRKRLANVASVVEDAADELGDKEVPDHEPDPDWTARFFNDVQDVSSEEMQKLWARVLAGEVDSPGRTSLRTLDTLRNMTKKDAETFRDICDFVIDGTFVFYNHSVEGLDGLNYTKLLHLQDCRLVTIVPDLVNKIAWRDPPYTRLAHHGGFLALSRDQLPDTAGRELEIPVVILTTAGQELFHFTQGAVNMKYLQRFSKFLKSKSSNLAYVGKVEPSTGGSADSATVTLIEPESESLVEPIR